MKKRYLAALLLLLLCGCFKVKDELTLQADGSGTVRIETRSLVPAEMFEAMGMGARMGGAGETVIYPPLTEAEARKFFPGNNFTVTVKEEQTEDGNKLVVMEAAFKDVNALLATPYGRAHALTLKVENGVLVLKAITGIESAARFAEMKDEDGMLGGEMPGLTELQKKKEEMRTEFRVTLPNPVTAGNGTREGKTVSWVVERAKAKDTAEFAKQAGLVLEASCSANGLKMSPLTPVRLGLVSFNELPAGATAEKASLPDAKKIAIAAKFLPYALQVTRSLDLSGEGGSHENRAQLIGAIVVPKELAPQKWGEAKLEEVVDAKGNSLKSEEGREGFFGGERHFMGGMEDEEDEEDESEDKPASSAEERKVVALTFQPPDWKVKEIARIKGSMSLQYFGGSHVVKLSNAIPANRIVDAKKAMSGGLDPSEKALSDPMLSGLGMSLRLQMGMSQSGYTMLMLQVSGQKAVLADAQVFDAEGRPWPTLLQNVGFGDTDTCQVIVAGRPQPPLSLALLARSVGATVEVPILLEKVPVTGK